MHYVSLFYQMPTYESQSWFLHIAGRYFFTKNLPAELPSGTATPLKCLLDKKEVSELSVAVQIIANAVQRLHSTLKTQILNGILIF